MADAGSGGASGAAQGGGDTAGAPGAGAGDDHGGAGSGAGEAGAETGGIGGSPAHGGMAGRLGNAGGGSSGGGGAPIEPSLPPGLLLWLRADRGIQLKDAHVQVWQDQSANHTDATQGSVNERPSYLAAGFNGRPTLEFDGQQQFLTFLDGFGDFSTGLAGLIVARPFDSECGALFEFSNGSEIDDVFMGVGNKKWQYEVQAANLQEGNVDLERFSLFAINHRMAGTGDLLVNGSVLSSFDIRTPIVPESGVRVNNFVGHSLYGGVCSYFRGQISEIILYSRSLSYSELNTIETYLDAHWALNEQETQTP